MPFLNGTFPTFKKIKLQNSFIGFENFCICCKIGVYPEEKISHQEILLDLKVAFDITRAINSDCVEHTIDYTAMASQCQKIAESKHYHLLETYASDVLDQILTSYPISWAWIKVKKPKGLPSADFSLVEMEKYVEVKNE